MKVPKPVVAVIISSILLASTAFSETIAVITQRSTARYPYLKRKIVWVYPYYSYQPSYVYNYLGSYLEEYLEYLQLQGGYSNERRFMVWTGDGKYLGALSPVWTADGKNLYRLSNVWTGDGKNLHNLSSVWTGDGKNLPYKSSVWTGDGREVTFLPAWTEGFFK